MNTSSPHPVAVLVRFVSTSLLTIVILVYWEDFGFIDQWLIPVWFLVAGILGYGAAFGQLRHSVVAFILITALGVLQRSLFRMGYSPWLMLIVLLVYISLVVGLVFGRALVDIRERRKKDTPLWVNLLLVLGLSGVLVRVVLEPILGRESMVALLSSADASVRLPRIRSASVDGSSLYFLTLLVEGGCALVRTALLYLPMLLTLIPLHILVLMFTRDDYYGPIQGMFGATGQYGIDNTRWIVEGVWLILRYTLLITGLVGFSPVLLSLFHALMPFARTGSGTTEIESLGARAPTRAEQTKIIDTLQEIQARAGSQLAAPSHWRIIDDPTPDAYTIGSTIYLARGAVESPQLAGLVAHELGHIAHKDGDLVLALRRFIIPVAYYIGIDRHPMPAGTVVSTGTGVRQRLIRSEDEKIYYRFQTLQIKFWLAFWLGGMGLLLLGQQWAHFWRQRDFLADDYTVALGFEQQLMELLHMYRHVDVAQPFLLSNRPYTAERLDRLEG